jgi:hypothetical protein
MLINQLTVGPAAVDGTANLTHGNATAPYFAITTHDLKTWRVFIMRDIPSVEIYANNRSWHSVNYNRGIYWLRKRNRPRAGY